MAEDERRHGYIFMYEMQVEPIESDAVTEEPDTLLRPASLPDVSFDREQTKGAVAKLAARGVFVGTSSWKYPGWRGQLYDEERYATRGKFSESRFNRDCLAEYAEVFKTVCVDAAYYKFPDQRYLKGMGSQVPQDFLFGFKVTDEITIRKFSSLPRFGMRAGKPNENFLNADLFAKAFLTSCEPFRSVAIATSVAAHP